MRLLPWDKPLDEAAVDALVVPVFAGGELPAGAREAVSAVAGDLRPAAARLPLEKSGAYCWVGGGPAGPDVLLVCVGDGVDHEAGADGLRLAAMTAGRVADRRRTAAVLASARPSDPAAGVLVAENWVMGAYRFDGYRSEPPASVREEVLMWGCTAESVETGRIIGEAACLARDLVNTPGGDLTPLRLAELCRGMAADAGFTVKVLHGRDLVDGGFGALLGVGAGSSHPPVLIEIERGRRDLPHLALVGKGITFDAGGLSLKTTGEMRTMKADMAGAASIIGALAAAARLDLPTHVRAYLACAENMPGGTAMRVGDVVRHRNGLTTEVVDTDCEGRLVLSDALALAAESGPTHIVDIATLSSNTGLGPEVWAAFGTDRALVRDLLDAGEASGEPGWHMPLLDRYEERLRSDIADLRNHAPGMTSPFGAALAALYLRRFVPGKRWAHLDMGLTVTRDADTDAWRAGANGNGTRTLIRHLVARASTHTNGDEHPPVLGTGRRSAH